MRFPCSTQSMGLPAVEVAQIHRNAPQCICPQCHKHWRECGCEMNPKLRGMIGDPPHQARPWGFHGTMRLPDDHPDNPNRKTP